MTNDQIVSAGDPSSEQVDDRIRKVRIGASVLVAIAAASLVVAVIINPVPVAFVLTALLVGGLMALGGSFLRSTDISMAQGFLIGIIFGSMGILRDWLFPEMNDDLFTTFWTGMSAWALGFSLVALPLVRFSFERKRKTIRTDLASVQRYREGGDSAFVAQMRMSARKSGKGYMITLMVMGAVMAALGLYTWLFMDLLIGLVLALMMALMVAFFAWMLKLRRGA